MKSSHCRNIWSTQKSANEVYIENSNGNKTTIYSDISITELYINENNFVITNGKNVIVYKIQYEDDNDVNDIKKSLSIKTLNTFVTDCLEIFLYEQSIVTLGQMDIKILSLGGIILQNLILTDGEGEFCSVFFCFCFFFVFNKFS